MAITEIPERISHLILLYLHKQLSDLQRKELDRWILQDETHEIVFDQAINIELKPKKKVKKDQPIDVKTLMRKRGII